MLRSLSLFAVASFTIASLVALACGSDSGGSGPPGSLPPAAPVAKEQFLSQYASIICSGMQTCCATGGYGYDPGACPAILGADGGVGSALSGIGNLDTPGATYNAQAAGDCLAALRANYGDGKRCQGPSGTEDQNLQRDLAQIGATYGIFACSRVLTGTKQPGEECKPGECAVPPGPYDSVTCQRLDFDQLTLDGGTPPSQNPVCVTTTWGAKLGEPCNDDLFSTTRNVQCGTVPDLLAQYQNVHTLDDVDKLPILTCDKATKLCVQGQTHVATGGACDDTHPCGRHDDCSADKKCVAEPKLGEACTGNCDDDLYCDRASNKCAPKKDDGQPCESSSDCKGQCNEKSLCAPGERLCEPNAVWRLLISGCRHVVRCQCSPNANARLGLVSRSRCLRHRC